MDLAAIQQVDDPAVQDEIARHTRQVIEAESPELTQASRDRLYEDLQDELFRFGPLERLLADPTVSDILVNRPDEVYVERHGQLEKTTVQFADEDHLLRILQRIVGLVGRRLDRSSPLVDARLPDGSRVNAVIPPLSLDGPKLSIRRFVAQTFDTEVLCENGAMSRDMCGFLRACVEARVSMLFSGGTGAGKTTLLSALSSAIPADERLVSIEDSAELVLQHPHVVKMETRPSNQEGSGQFNLQDLVRNSLRMRPDRIIVGEVRGPEAIDMIQAMNTGHEGSMTTLHANSTKDALARLQLMVATAKVDLPAEVVREFIVLGIPLVVHLARLKGGVRRITQISELTSDGAGRIQVLDVFRFVPGGLNELGQAVGRFEGTGYRPSFLHKLKARGIELDGSMFEKRHGESK